jgi:hypothetical protein
MTLEEYAEAQAKVSATVAREVAVVTSRFLTPRMSESAWIQFLKFLFPIVLRARDKSSRLARDFYDSQRELYHPELPKHPLFLANYELSWFIEAMEPERALFSRPGASEQAEARVIGRVLKEVENGGRRTIIRPVEDSDEEIRDPVALGYARVATGRETCGWCWMLVSRGPVYRTRESAGEEKKFHPFCDCKVVPVFDRKNWPGRDAFIRAQKVWKKHTKGARNNKDAMNMFRRAVDGGLLNPKDFAAIRSA